jgi:hypothetical protein
MVTACATVADTDLLFIVGNTPARSASVSLRRRADYVAVPVIISDDPKVHEREKKNHFRRQTAKALVAAIEKSRSKLRVRQVSWTKQPYLYLLMEMETTPRDMAYYTDRVEELFKTIFFTGKSRCELGGPTLALEDPEEHRTQLTRMIFDDVNRLTKSLGTAALVTVDGLGRPVQVKQIDDQRVELFINYSLSIEMER